MAQSTHEMLQHIEDRWDSLTIADDFVFGKVMLDEGICREVLEAILHVPIERIEYIGREETLDAAPGAKGVRLDAYVRDGQGTVYDIEMQATNTRELPQRSRYYHSMLAFAQLARGARYRALKDSYVIFICDFDLFGEGRRVYSFTNREEENTDLRLNDGTHTIFLAATSPAEPSKGAEVNELLDYVAKGKVSGALSSKLQGAVARVLNNENWRLEYMWQEVRDQLNMDKGRELGFKEGHDKGLAEGHEVGLREGRDKGLAEGREAGLREGREAGVQEGREAGLREGREAGRQEGHDKGLAEGEKKFAALVARLIKSGREGEVERAASDPSYRQQLYREFDMGD